MLADSNLLLTLAEEIRQATIQMNFNFNFDVTCHMCSYKKQGPFQKTELSMAFFLRRYVCGIFIGFEAHMNNKPSIGYVHENI